MHDTAEPSGSPGPRRQYVCVKPFIENAASAENCTAAETPRKKHETYPTARNGQIRKTPRISTVNPSRKCSARRTQARRPDRTHGDERAIHVVDRILHDKAPRDQRRGANRLHGVDFLKPRPEGAASSSKLSLSQFWTPIGGQFKRSVTPSTPGGRARPPSSSCRPRHGRVGRNQFLHRLDHLAQHRLRVAVNHVAIGGVE